MCSLRRFKEFFIFFIGWVACNLSVPFWVVGHVHLTLNIYDDIKEIIVSFGMNIIVAIGFWLEWKKNKKMDILSKILKEFPDDGYLKVDGFDNALIGISSNGALVYSIDKIVEILMKRNNWSSNDAYSYFLYSISATYVGDKKPIFINLIN
jgi:hypothetical protein